MTSIRQEIQEYISAIPDGWLVALRPLLEGLANDALMAESNLTADEVAIIEAGRKEYLKGKYVSIDSIS